MRLLYIACMLTVGCVKWRHIATVLPVCATVACADGAHDDSAARANADAQSNPVADAYAALERGDYSALPGVISALDDAVASDPDSAWTAFFAGVMRLWRFTQRNDDPSYTDFASDLQTAFDDLDKARTLDPLDPHAAAFYGIAEVAAGDLVGDQQRIEDGRQVLEQAVPLYPAYVHGVQALAFGALAKDHPDFPLAAQALDDTISACAFQTTDAGTPSLASESSFFALTRRLFSNAFCNGSCLRRKCGVLFCERVGYGCAPGFPFCEGVSDEAWLDDSGFCEPRGGVAAERGHGASAQERRSGRSQTGDRAGGVSQSDDHGRTGAR
jgi:hypothetical protein